MSHIFCLLFLLTNFYTFAICHTKCKEYLIIIKETSCPTNLSIIREPIKLDDLNWNHDNYSDDSLKMLSDDKNYSNTSYVTCKFDYSGIESICVPIIKSTKLFEHIKMDDENITMYENEEFGKDKHEINKTTVIENNTTKTDPLKCLIKNYKHTCDKKESKETLRNEIKRTVEINLIHTNEPTSNNIELIYKNTEASILFEKCVLNDDLCTSSSTIDDHTEKNDTILQIAITLSGNHESSVIPVVENNTDQFNCTNIINKHKNINFSYINALTSSIITKYYCQYNKVDNRNLTLPIFDVSVLSLDLNILNTKLRYINCTENIEHTNSSTLSIECSVNTSIEMNIKNNHYTMTSGNNSLQDIDLFEEDFNQSLVYRCKLKKVNFTKESYSETVEIFNIYKEFDYQTCIEEYSNDDKKAHLDGSKVLIISDEVYKNNFTNLENFGSNAEIESLKLHFLHNNVSDCSDRIPFNISKGRIFSQWLDDEKDLAHNGIKSTLFKLVITKCDHFNTKSPEYENNLELDIILINTNNTRSHNNETKENKFKNRLWNSSNTAILHCGYFNENTQLYNINSVMECVFLESSNDNMTTAAEISTSKSPIRNENMHLNDHHNDSFNVHDKSMNTTTKKTKENYFGNEQESADEGKIGNGKKLLKGDVTTEPNTSREKGALERNQTEDSDPLQEMNYVSPRVYATAVVALLAVVGSVLTYALCMIKRNKGHEYHVTPTRDWSEMDATEF